MLRIKPGLLGEKQVCYLCAKHPTPLSSYSLLSLQNEKACFLETLKLSKTFYFLAHLRQLKYGLTKFILNRQESFLLVTTWNCWKLKVCKGLDDIRC